MRFLIRPGLKQPAVGLASLCAAPLAIAFGHHPSWALALTVLGILAAAGYLASRLQAHGEASYSVYYLLLLYAFLAPSMLAGASPRDFLFYYAATAILLFLPQTMWPQLLFRVLCGIGILIGLIVAAGFFGQAAQTGELPSRLDLLAVYQSDPAEAIAYATTFIHPVVLCLILVVLLGLLALVVAWQWPTLRAFPRRYQFLVLGCAFGLAWATQLGSHERLVVATIVEYHRSLVDYRRTAARRQVDQRQITAHQTRAAPETHLIVIGESGNRSHMGLYGYFRETTPHLSRTAAELVVFEDVVSAQKLTMQSLHQALTLADADNHLPYADPHGYSIIELLKAAGVRTHWLSNQNRYGIWDNVVTVIAEGADHVDFESKHFGKVQTPDPDERLLPALERVLEHDSGPKVIFVHLMGQHVPYARRYPPEFARFDGPLPVAGFGGRERSRQIGEMVNTYDNATLYVDHVLHRMLEIVQRRTTSATLLYFSDHGEAPLEGLPRADSRFHPDHVEIPFLLWFSKGFAERHPELVRIAKANRDKRFMLDELEDTVLDLVGIETPYLEPKRSLLRATYTEPTRLLFNGKLDYDRYDDPLLTAWRNMRTVAEIRPALHDRIWAHRVDTLGKLSDIADLFAGAELDLVFDQATGLLEVRDPPTPHYGLTLEHVLDAQRARQGRLNLWLDIKEMDSDNAARILARLAELDRHHILKDRVIVETTFKGAGVKRFAKSGFYTSHQLSTDEVQAALQDPGRLSELATETCEVVKSSGFAAISFDMIVYPFVRDYLAPCAAEQDLDYLVRDLALSSSRPEFADAACRWELDERIKVVLVPVASRYDI